MILSNFNRNFIKLFELIKSTMPIIKYFKEVNQRYSNFLNDRFIKLFLIIFNYPFRLILLSHFLIYLANKVISLEYNILLVQLIFYQAEYYLSNMNTEL